MQAVFVGEALVVVDLVVVVVVLIFVDPDVKDVIGVETVEDDELEAAAVEVLANVDVAVVEVGFPSEGVAEHVDTRSPVANLVRPSGANASLGPSGTVPTTKKSVIRSSRLKGRAYRRH